MTPRHFWELESCNTERLCKLAGTTVANFQQIAVFGGSVSAHLAVKLSMHSEKCGGYMSLDDILNPKDSLMVAARKLRAEQRSQSRGGTKNVGAA